MKNIIIIFCLIFLQVYGDQKIISHFKDLVLMPKFLQTQQDNQKVIDGDTLTNPTPAPTPTTQPAVNPEDNPDPQYKLFPMIIALSSGKQELQAQKELGNLLYDEPDYVVLKKTERSQQRLYYVQGFKFLNKNTIIESSGLYGESVMHLLDSETFQETKSVDLDQNHFGEGSDWIKNSNGNIEIHQMTYKERDIYVYDQDLKLLNTFKMPETMKEGWGLARSPGYFYI